MSDSTPVRPLDADWFSRILARAGVTTDQVSAQCERALIEAITSETKAMCATDGTDWKEKLPIVGTNTAPLIRDLLADPTRKTEPKTWAEKIRGILKTHGALPA